VILSDQAEIA